MTRTALNVVQNMRGGLRTERGEDVDLARELDLLLSLPKFVAFLGTIEMTRSEVKEEK